MVKRSICAALLTICGAFGSVTAVAAQAGPEQGSWGVIQNYCFGCHNSKARVAGLAFDSMSPDRIADDATRTIALWGVTATVHSTRFQVNFWTINVIPRYNPTWNAPDGGDSLLGAF